MNNHLIRAFWPRIAVCAAGLAFALSASPAAVATCDLQTEVTIKTELEAALNVGADPLGQQIKGDASILGGAGKPPGVGKPPGAGKPSAAGRPSNHPGAPVPEPSTWIGLGALMTIFFVITWLKRRRTDGTHT